MRLPLYSVSWPAFPKRKWTVRQAAEERTPKETLVNRPIICSAALVIQVNKYLCKTDKLIWPFALLGKTFQGDAQSRAAPGGTKTGHGQAELLCAGPGRRREGAGARAVSARREARSLHAGGTFEAKSSTTSVIRGETR